MRQEVPQFIDVEDKLFGPLTFKQFLYLVGGGGLAYLSYKIIPFPFSFIGVLFFVAFALALAFYKMNGQPFMDVLISWLSYTFKKKLYLWKHEEKSVVPKKTPPTLPFLQKKTTEEPKETTPVQHQSIDELAKNLDILDTHT